MEGAITWVGIDAHKKSLAVALLAPGRQLPEEFTVPNDERSIRKLARRLKREAMGQEVRACYEAGTCGYTLQRRLEAAGVVCEVSTRSLPTKNDHATLRRSRRNPRIAV